MTASDVALTLRPPRLADRDRVAQLVEATGVFRPDEIAVAVEVFNGAASQPGVDYHGICALDGDALTGFTVFGPTPCTASTWDLYWIVVAPDAQGRGIGRQLMAAAETAIRWQGGTLVVVETSSRNDYGPTRAFYETIAYVPAAHIQNYYGPGDDLVVYIKSLSPPDAETTHNG
ncbi:MAG: GNAT family N-acetyltransferase [Gemmatimonadota bacterium]|nr:GNAT family N-acetyltransferase [Gemmatimonadota bacterium]